MDLTEEFGSQAVARPRGATLRRVVLSSIIAAFATYGGGGFARPVGAAMCGHYGDKIGLT